MDELSAILNQVIQFIGQWGDFSAQAKLANIVLIIVALWKTSFLRNLFWDKLGVWKVVVAPALGVLGAFLAIEPFTWSAVWTGLQGGLLAVAVHQLLEVVKVLPGIGSVYVGIIDFIAKLLKAPDQA